MKHSRRMVVISEAEYKKLKSQSFHNIKKHQVALTKKTSKRIRQQLLDKKPFVSAKTALQVSPATAESFFIPEHQSQVAALLSELQAQGAKINQNRELVMPYGDTVEDSNIISLMKELLTGTRRGEKPIGWREFITLIANTNIPLTSFKKRSSKEAVSKVREDRVKDWENF